ncbi:MAG: hypothetical protein MPJ78_15625 [Hyphomicrobiaceae bacterium]|nr:hypothetical protein [Hyphomicrobiaceae bacterium]
MDKVRILPLLVFAGLCLLVLKTMGLFLTGGYVLSGSAPAVAQNAAGTKTDDVKEGAAKSAEPAEASEEKTGAAEENGTSEQRDALGPETPKAKTTDASGSEEIKKKKAETAENPSARDVTAPSLAPGQGATKAERAILEGLSNRRKTLDKRARELELRENLLKAAEKRVEAKIAELKSIESRIEGELKKHDDGRKAEYQRLVQMYSNMKPKDAAKIFDRLDLNVLTDLVRQMKPRVMSAILAAMTPAAAERLTLAIASTRKPATSAADTLPKISSR